MAAGYLSLHMGPMRAGKSCYATRKATEYADMGERVIYVTYLAEERLTEGGHKGVFTSHSSSNVYLTGKVTSKEAKNLGDIDVAEYDVIVVDEGQFYGDLVGTVLKWVDTLCKRVIVVGLDSSFRRSPIGHIIDLVPHADFYEKLFAKCEMCYAENKDKPLSSRIVDAPFTMRVTDDESLFKIGNGDYVAVCRLHHKSVTQ